MGQFVIVAYRPKAGQEAALHAAVRDHLAVLRGEGLATEFPPLVLRAGDGTLLEIFEWKSAGAIEQAHHTPAVQALWARFEAACEYERLANLAECQALFATFAPVDLASA